MLESTNTIFFCVSHVWKLYPLSHKDILLGDDYEKLTLNIAKCDELLPSLLLTMTEKYILLSVLSLWNLQSKYIFLNPFLFPLCFQQWKLCALIQFTYTSLYSLAFEKLGFMYRLLRLAFLFESSADYTVYWFRKDI